VSNYVTSLGPVRKLMDSVVGIDARRETLTFERTTLVDWSGSADVVGDRTQTDAWFSTPPGRVHELRAHCPG